MQDKKEYREKLFISFQVNNQILHTNFYRRLKERLNLNSPHFLTAGYYEENGRKNMEAIVRFKMCVKCNIYY